MTSRRSWRLFHRSFILFFGLGVIPILIIAIAFALPHPLNFSQFKLLIGILLVVSTVSTLCLAGLVVKILKRPLQRLLVAQNEVKRRNLNYRLLPEGSYEMQLLFQGFNEMASAVALAAEQEKQIAADKSLSKVASQVVHDLRSPLTSLQVVSDYFESNAAFNSDDSSGIIKILKLSIGRIKNIAEELLNRRKDNSSQTPTLLHNAIDDLIAEFQARKHSQLEFITHYHQPSIPLSASKADLQRVFGNIITNAVEAMQAVGTIQIRTTDTEVGVCIQIEDNGPGMSEDILKKVLRGGFTYGKLNGNGVGMMVVREIVAKYNGSLRAISTPGIGTTFFIEFPIYSAV